MKEVATIPDETVDESARLLRTYLEQETNGIELIGGRKWWTIRGRALTGEWIEMKKDFVKRAGKPAERTLLYIHGGAYFFSSLQTHRYQIQRHARKLGARAFAPSYRLAPQYPFPCGLQDILASYLYLINPPPGASHAAIPPHQIIVSGDSAGGGAVIALLVLLRDLGLPLPAGASLISPWVDLAHSFPSCSADDSGDYIPSSGFHYKPGLAWPPAKGQGILAELAKGEGEVLMDEQIQVGGSAELLRDEQIYLAHKAASPSEYPPSHKTLEAYPYQKTKLETPYPPTTVHLSMYDNAAHVTPTLSITRPAKYMYRTVANFGIWALTASEKKQERLERHESRPESTHHIAGPVHATDAAAANEEEHSVDSDDESELSSLDGDSQNPENSSELDLVTVTGHEPSFVNHMVRERVSPAGRIRAMEAPELLPGCTMPRDEIGILHLGPVTKWKTQRAEWDARYAKEHAKFRAIRDENERRVLQEGGFLEGKLKFDKGENPPLCALARFWDQKLALEVGESVDEVGKKVNAALAMWARVSSQPDEQIAGPKQVEEAKAQAVPAPGE
ncbi:hypothetical protein RQP46_004522 [Phenoliferia psychrophenolica]